jgi:chitodextrinase
MTDLFYLRSGQGISGHTGARGASAVYDTESLTEMRYAPSVELGYRFSSALSLGLGYQLGTNLDGVRNETVQSVQLLTRYKMGARDWIVSPYLELGINASTGRDRFRYGPSTGGGLDITVDSRLSVFAKSRLHLTVPTSVPFLPKEAADAYDAASGIPLNVLTVTSIGAEFVLRSKPTVPRIRRVLGPSRVRLGDSITFSATINAANVAKPVERRWTFGNGESETGMTATHTFGRPGRHTVLFEAENRTGSDRTSLTVTVQDTLRPVQISSVEVPPASTTVGRKLEFRGQAEGEEPLSYKWRFGDGTTASRASVLHTYAEAGKYTVQFSAANGAGSASRTFTLRVDSAPASSNWGPYVIQIGAFDERENAERTALRALADGYAARVQSIDQEEPALYRVWVGNFWAREIARRTLPQLRGYSPDAFVRETQRGKRTVEASIRP